MPYTIEALLHAYTPSASEKASYEELLTLLQTHERPFDRESMPGHITGSAVVLHPDGTKILLTHHKKLGKWLQLGGHSDDDSDTLRVAHREAWEESGLAPEDILVEHPGIFDVDVHAIPAHGDVPAHRHFDINFLFRATTEDFVVSEESHDLAWVPLEELATYTQEARVLRAAEKIRALTQAD